MNNPAESFGGMPEIMPIKPMGGRESVPSLTDAEYAELCQLVDEFPNFTGDEDPKYKRWEELQTRANIDTDTVVGV